jgi:hypothetical protein
MGALPDLQTECRAAVRALLAERPGLAFDLTYINRRLEYDMGQIAAQLSELIQLKEVETIKSAGGGVIYFIATQRGISEHEKSAYR